MKKIVLEILDHDESLQFIRVMSRSNILILFWLFVLSVLGKARNFEFDRKFIRFSELLLCAWRGLSRVEKAAETDKKNQPSQIWCSWKKLKLRYKNRKNY